MKIIAICIALSFSSFTGKSPVREKITVSPTSSLDYCQGFADGFKEGYCYGRGPWCTAPYPPLCPLLRPYEPDNYNSGFERGYRIGASY